MRSVPLRSQMHAESAICLAMTGASGAQYGLRLLELLLGGGSKVYLLVSKPAQVVIGTETGLELPGRSAEIERFFNDRYAARAGQLRVFGREEWTAPIASGSGAPRAMVVCPCSMATVSAIACGASRSLIERAADVMLKERRPLIVVPRETPLSMLHLDNLLRIARAGGTILPANPGFYNRPQTIEDLVDFVVARIMNHLGIAHSLMPVWGGET